jgi:aminoglycoside phosphotransferase (APT) family kinase protein
MSSPPPAELTEATSATELLQRAGFAVSSAEPVYVRHKPLETTVIAYRLKSPRGSDTWGYARWCHDRSRADDVYRKALALGPQSSDIGPGVARPDPHTVMYGFPNDTGLRRLRWFADPRKIKRSLEPLTQAGERISGSRSAVTVLRYKPERRVVARVDLVTTQRKGSFFVRYRSGAHTGRLHRLANHLRGQAIDTPAPVAELEGGRVTIDDYVDGVSAADAVRNGSLEPRRLADAIAAFHAATPPFDAPQRTIESESARAVSGLEGLSTWHPDLAEPARSLAELLRRRRPTSRSGPTSHPVLLHGDLHSDNVMIVDGRINFIDLERVAVGPASIDLGFLLANSIALDVRRPGWSPYARGHAEAVVKAYPTSDVVDRQALRWSTAVGLAEQAILTARQLDRCWHVTAGRLLDMACHHLAGTDLMATRAPTR